MGRLPEPKEGSIFYDDGRVYACLAFEPIVEGHTIVAWKREHKNDISELSSKDYIYLMSVLNRIRSALMEVYSAPKVYLVYLDETGDVHWHLFPRKAKDTVRGFDLICQKASNLDTTSAETALKSLRDTLDMTK